VRRDVHEYSIVQALIDRVHLECDARGGARVVRLWIRIGDLAGVDPDLLATAYDTFRERSICADAPLEIRRVAARWSCPRCGERIATGDVLRCRGCGAPATLSEGDEIILDRIEMEVADV
jgi:hydrogenase nickel incorporation protein HypA/HybF